MNHYSHPVSETSHVFFFNIDYSWLSSIFYNGKIQMVSLGLAKANNKANVIQMCPGST